jgi:hypothetical protein
MKEIEIKQTKHVESPYSTGGTAFCWCSARQKDGSYYQLSRFTGCKDFLHDGMHNHQNNGKSKVSNATHGYNPKIKPCMSINKIRLLMTTHPINKEEKYRPYTSEEQVFTGKRILNIIEDELGWKHTTIKRVKHPVEKQVFMLVGSRAWLKASFFISAYALIMRASSYNTASEELKSWDDVQKLFKAWKGNDTGLISTASKYFIPILKRRKELFSGFGKEVIWPPSIGFGFHNPGGFVNLCNGSTFSPDINKRIKEMKTKYKM